MSVGLTIVEDYLSKKEEKELLSLIDSLPWSNALSRRVQQYGYSYSYFPPYKAEPIKEKMPNLFQKYMQGIDSDLNQVITFGFVKLVNEYLPGQGISKHTDHKTLFGETIVSLSLGSAVMMDFSGPGEEFQIYLKPRTLVLMERDIRWKYTQLRLISDLLFKLENQIQLKVRLFHENAEYL